MVEGFDLDGFSDRLRRRRIELGLNQEQFAVQVGVASSAAWRWENGTLPRDVETLAKIAQSLRVSVGYLMGEKPGIDKVETAISTLSWVSLQLEELRRMAKDRPEDLLGEIAGARQTEQVTPLYHGNIDAVPLNTKEERETEKQRQFALKAAADTAKAKKKKA